MIYAALPRFILIASCPDRGRAKNEKKNVLKDCIINDDIGLNRANIVSVGSYSQQQTKIIPIVHDVFLNCSRLEFLTCV